MQLGKENRCEYNISKAILVKHFVASNYVTNGISYGKSWKKHKIEYCVNAVDYCYSVRG